VTNLGTDSRAVVRFDNKRGTVEQWIKEGTRFETDLMLAITLLRFSASIRFPVSVQGQRGCPHAELDVFMEMRRPASPQGALAGGVGTSRLYLPGQPQNGANDQIMSLSS
jgi:hypothetical protein